MSYEAIKYALYSKKVITGDERKIIEAKGTNKEKMEHLIIDILIVSLDHSCPDKYRGFLVAMETNDDILLQQKAKELGKLCNLINHTYVRNCS